MEMPTRRFRSSVERHFSGLLSRYPALEPCAEDIARAFAALRDCFAHGGKLLLCGNGGSAADAEHIAGELMKSFVSPRPLSRKDQAGLAETFGEEGAYLAARLQGALPAIPLTGFTALSTAFANDVDPGLVFAQQVWGLGAPQDALLAISTSGNAENIRRAAQVAKYRGLRTIGLTGSSGGKLAGFCDICIRVPETGTFKVQELHLPVYHALCLMLESDFLEE